MTGTSGVVFAAVHGVSRFDVSVVALGGGHDLVRLGSVRVQVAPTPGAEVLDEIEAIGAQLVAQARDARLAAEVGQ